MIVRGGTRLRTAFWLIAKRNKAAIVVVLAIETGAWSLHELFPDLQSTAFSAAAVGVFATVVGLFVAFRFNEAYVRWWEARILWGGMVNASRTFARQVTTLLTPDRLATLEKWDQARSVHRELVYRHLAYVNALRLQLRDQPVFPDIDVYLEATESKELRSAANVATQLNQRQGSRLASLLDSDPAATLILTQMDASLTQLMDYQGGMERINNTAFPDRVIVTTRILVWAVAIPAWSVRCSTGRVPVTCHTTRPSSTTMRPSINTSRPNRSHPSHPVPSIGAKSVTKEPARS